MKRILTLLVLMFALTTNAQQYWYVMSDTNGNWADANTLGHSGNLNQLLQFLATNGFSGGGPTNGISATVATNIAAQQALIATNALWSNIVLFIVANTNLNVLNATNFLSSSATISNLTVLGTQTYNNAAYTNLNVKGWLQVTGNQTNNGLVVFNNILLLNAPLSVQGNASFLSIITALGGLNMARQNITAVGNLDALAIQSGSFTITNQGSPNAAISSDQGNGGVSITAGAVSTLAKVKGKTEVAPTTGGNTNRYLNDKLSDILSVKDFGSFGTNVPDDSVGIQNNVYFLETNSSVGGVVFLPSGTYNIANTIIVTNGNIYFRGDNNGASILVKGLAGNIITFLGSTNVNGPQLDRWGIKDLYLSAGTQTDTNALIGLYFVKHGTLEHVFFNGSGPPTGCPAIDAVNWWDSDIIGCQFQSLGGTNQPAIYLRNNNGVYLTTSDCNSLHFFGNRFEQCAKFIIADGTYASSVRDDQVQFFGNKFETRFVGGNLIDLNRVSGWQFIGNHYAWGEFASQSMTNPVNFFMLRDNLGTTIRGGECVGILCTNQSLRSFITVTNSSDPIFDGLFSITGTTNFPTVAFIDAQLNVSRINLDKSAINTPAITNFTFFLNESSSNTFANSYGVVYPNSIAVFQGPNASAQFSNPGVSGVTNIWSIGNVDASGNLLFNYFDSGANTGQRGYLTKAGLFVLEPLVGGLGGFFIQSPTVNSGLFGIYADSADAGFTGTVGFQTNYFKIDVNQGTFDFPVPVQLNLGENATGGGTTNNALGFFGKFTGNALNLTNVPISSLTVNSFTNAWLPGMGARKTNDLSVRWLDVTLVGNPGGSGNAYAQILVEQSGPSGPNGSTNTIHWTIPAASLASAETNTFTGIFLNPGAVVTVTNLSGTGGSVTQIGSMLH